MPVFYELVGARGLEVDFANASKDRRVKLEKVSRDTALAISRRAKAGAPDDPATSPDLKSAITFEGKGLNWKVGIEDRSYPSRGGNFFHQSPWIYGVWYEYGFLHKNIQTTPYMRPAADAEEAGHFERLEAVMNESLS